MAQFNIDENGHCVIPAGTTEIGERAFVRCRNLQSVKIPNGVTSIGAYAFMECDSLKSVEMPDSVTEIGEFAFGGCRSLQSIEISDSVTSIGQSAFLKSKSLSSLTLHYKEPNDLSPEIVDRLPISDRITLHVPVGTGEAYRHHSVFSKAKEVVDDVR